MLGPKHKILALGLYIFMLFVSISFALGSQCKRSLQWNMGLSISEDMKPLGSGITCGVWVQDGTGLIYRMIQMVYANELYSILSFVDLPDEPNVEC